MNELFGELDEQARFEEFKDHPNESVRRELVYTLTDENLIHTFKDDSDWGVRQAVVDKLSDTDELLRTFKDDLCFECSSIRSEEGI